MSWSDLTPEGFAAALEAAMGWPSTPANTAEIVAWEQAEGGMWHNNAAYNPLNTTQDAPGASSVNSVGVKAYPDPQTGLQATVDTLNNGRYQPIVADLASGSAAPGAFAADVGASPWGTSGTLIAQILQGRGAVNYNALIDPSGVNLTSTSNVAGQASTAAASLVSDPFSALTSGEPWIRAGEAVLGAGLLMLGLVLFAAVLLDRDMPSVPVLGTAVGGLKGGLIESSARRGRRPVGDGRSRTRRPDANRPRYGINTDLDGDEPVRPRDRTPARPKAKSYNRYGEEERVSPSRRYRRYADEEPF